MNRVGALAVALTGSLAYGVAVVCVSGLVLLRRGREARATPLRGDFLDALVVPAWWWALLLVPPLTLVGWWLFRHGRRGA